MKKKVTGLLLALVMLLSLIPATVVTASAATAAADQTVTVGDYQVLIPKGVEIPTGVDGNTDVTVLTDSDETYSIEDDGWYVVVGIVTISEIQTSWSSTGCKLILADGCKLTVTGGYLVWTMV